jgi:hypothetical protein
VVAHYATGARAAHNATLAIARHADVSVPPLWVQAVMFEVGPYGLHQLHATYEVTYVRYARDGVYGMAWANRTWFFWIRADSADLRDRMFEEMPY